MINLNELIEYGLTKEQAISILEKIGQHITKMEREIEQKWEQKQKEKDVHSYVEKELILANARNIQATKALIDTPKIINEGLDKESIKKMILELKKDKKTAFLFLDERNKNNIKGNTPFESNIVKLKNTENMSYEELCEYYDKID